MASQMRLKFNWRMPGAYHNIEQRLARGIWPWTEGPRARLPKHFKLRYIDKHMREPVAVHFIPDTRKYKVDRHKQMQPVQNVPVPLIFPREADEGLWGGEAFLQGMRKKGDDPHKPRVWRLWRPFLMPRVFYSEILDEWLTITVTLRTLDLVDEVAGFDHYILSTHEVDLRSRLGMKLKAKMLQRLADGNLREEIQEKYAKYMIPEEEIEWVGLSIEEAERKQEELEEAQHRASIRPMKEKYMQDLIERMKNKSLGAEVEDEDGALPAFTSSGGWQDKLADMNPFKKS